MSDIEHCEYCGSSIYHPHQPYCRKSPHRDLWQFGFMIDNTTVSCRGCGAVVAALNTHESVCGPLRKMKKREKKEHTYG